MTGDEVRVKRKLFGKKLPNLTKLGKWERIEDIRKGFVNQAWSLAVFGCVNGVIAFLSKSYWVMLLNVFPILLGMKIVNSKSKWDKYKEEEEMVNEQVKEGNIK